MATRTKSTTRKKKETSVEQLRKEALKEIAAMDSEDEKVETKPAAAKKGRTKKATKRASTTNASKPAKESEQKKVSLIDAAVTILTDAKQPKTCKEIVEAVQARGLWSSAKGGLTPHATLYSAILREILKRKKEARFVKVERGKFELLKGA